MCIVKLVTGTTDYSTCQNCVMSTNMSAFTLINVLLCRPIDICALQSCCNTLMILCSKFTTLWHNKTRF